MFRRRTYLPWLVEALALPIARLLYTVRGHHASRVPTTGGVLLIANHLSYVDAVVLQLASPRPLRFFAQHGPRSPWYFAPIFRLAGVMTINSSRPHEAINRACEALRAGEAVCVFPEGHISRTGQLLGLRRGFELIAKKAAAPVVPVVHDGLWGSVFSFSGNKYLWKSPRLLPTPVAVVFGERIEAERIDVANARQALMDLAEEAFQERPLLQKNLAREAVRALARRPGDVVIIDRTGESRAMTSAQLLAVVAVLSRHFRKTIPDRRVGIVLPPGAGAFIANLAVACAGKIPVNLNFTAGRASVEASLRVGEISTVLSADAVRAKVPAFPWPQMTRDLRAEIAAAGGKRALLPWLIAAWILPNQIFANLLRLPRTGDREEAALLFTSGSAGEPKGVVLTHRNILANCAQISSLTILPENCTMLGCLPVFHSFGFTVTLWYPLIRGCKVVTIPSPLDTRKMIDAIHEAGVTVLVAAPTFVRPILKKAQSSELRSLDLVVTGAEKLPDDLYRGFQESFHLEILQGYGLTEASPVANVNQHNPPIATSTAEPQIGKKYGSVGRLVPGMTARIVDPETAVELPLTATGMLWLRGANIFSGYLGDAEKTRAALRGEWFVTGDLARFDHDGFLFIEGRLARFSKIGGEMVPHGTIENKIIEAFNWTQDDGLVAAVVGVPDASKGEALVLITTNNINAEELRVRLSTAGLPNLWIPKIVKQVEKIPMLGTGKVDLQSSRDLAQRAIDGNWN